MAFINLLLFNCLKNAGISRTSYIYWK